MMDKRFEIIKWGDDELALKHCAIHQPATDPRIRKDIEELVTSFKLKAVTSTYCAECLAVLREELK